MAVDFESQVPSTPTRNYKIGIIELVTRSLDVWISGILRNAIMIFPIALVIFASDFLLLFVTVPSLLSLIMAGTDPYSAIVTIVLLGQDLYITIPLFVIFTLLSIITDALIIGIVVRHGADRYLHDTTRSVSECISAAIARLPSIIGVQLVLTAITLVLSSPFLSLIFILFPDPSNFIFNPGMILFIILGFLVVFVSILYIGIRLILSSAMPILEDTSVVDSLRRSWALTRGNFWHIFIAGLILAIIVSLCNTGLSALLLTGFFYYPYYSDLVTMLSSLGFVSLVTTMFITPLNIVFHVVLYGDLKARSTEAAATYW